MLANIKHSTVGLHTHTKYSMHLEFGEEHGVLCGQPLGTVPSVERFMTASWIWGRAWSTLWPAPWHCAKCGALYDCILNLGKSMEYFVTSPLALCQSVECFMTASWIWGRAWSTLWPGPWHCAKVWSALWLLLHLKVPVCKSGHAFQALNTPDADFTQSRSSCVLIEILIEAGSGVTILFILKIKKIWTNSCWKLLKVVLIVFHDKFEYMTASY